MNTEKYVSVGAFQPFEHEPNVKEICDAKRKIAQRIADENRCAGGFRRTHNENSGLLSISCKVLIEPPTAADVEDARSRQFCVIGGLEYRKGEAFAADETYIKVRGINTYVWLIMNAACRSIIGYQVSDNRGVGPCILAMRMAFLGLKKLPENFKFIADGYSVYPLAAMEFAKKFGKDFTFQITQVIGLTNDDAVSKEHRPFKQIAERLNRTYKASYRKTNGFDNIEGANYDLALWVAYYNFLRPHKHNKYKVLNEVEMLQGADNMPGKWQLLIFLGQQTILNMQKTGTAGSERSCCQ